jgi:hypothetical protein
LAISLSRIRRQGAQTSGDPETWPEQWASEIMSVAKEALGRIEIGDPTHAASEERGPKCTWPVTFGRDAARSLPRRHILWQTLHVMCSIRLAGGGVAPAPGHFFAARRMHVAALLYVNFASIHLGLARAGLEWMKTRYGARANFIRLRLRERAAGR